MTSATLLHYPDDERSRSVFAFEHAMAHRVYYQVMSPLHRWSAMPYFIAPKPPISQTARRASLWHLDHQQAHNDFNEALPSDWNSDKVGIPTTQILLDSDLTDPGSLSWWVFANHQEHYTASAILLPAIPQAQTALTPAGATVVTPPPWINPLQWTLPPFW